MLPHFQALVLIHQLKAEHFQLKFFSPLVIVSFAHLSRPKLIPMSLEKVATVSRSEFNCFSLDANNSRSSTKNEWLTKLFDFRPFPT